MPVMHHVEYISELLAEGRINPGKVDGIVTYHDPCYLGRYNGITEEPREVLESIDGIEFVEMEHNKGYTLCCGGGGGGIWTENKEAREVTRRRLNEVLDVEAGIMATACPYCIRMFEDEAKLLNIDVSIVDVVEILSKSMV
jgi:Fe-S oxidoreductase